MDEILGKIRTQVATKTGPFFEKLPFSPNQLTALSGFFVVWAAFSLMPASLGTSVFAVLCLGVHALLNIADGEVARLRSETSSRGELLDRFLGNLNVLLLGVGLSIGAYNQSEAIGTLILGMFLVGAVFLIQFLPDSSRDWPRVGKYLLNANLFLLYVAGFALFNLLFLGLVVLTFYALSSLALFAMRALTSPTPSRVARDLHSA